MTEELDLYRLRRKRRFDLAVEIISGVLLMICLAAFVFVCVAGSGYHWE